MSGRKTKKTRVIRACFKPGYMVEQWRTGWFIIHSVSVQIRFPPQCRSFFDFPAERHMASFLMKKSVTHVSAGARRDMLEIPVLQAGKLGYGKHVRVV